jgi:hypothetical protein
VATAPQQKHQWNKNRQTIPDQFSPTQVQPIYRVIKKAGAVGLANLTDRLRRRLKDLGYAVPSLTDLKRAAQRVPPYRPEWAVSETEAKAEAVVRFVAEGPDGNFADKPEQQGLYDHREKEPRQLSNFSVLIE